MPLSTSSSPLEQEDHGLAVSRIQSQKQMSGALFVIPALLLVVILSALVFVVYTLRQSPPRRTSPRTTSHTHAYAQAPGSDADDADEDLELNLPPPTDDDDEFEMTSVTVSPSTTLLQNSAAPAGAGGSTPPRSHPPDHHPASKPTFASLARFFTLPFSTGSHSAPHASSSSSSPASSNPTDESDVSGLPPPPSFSSAHPESSTIQDRSIASARKRQQLRANIELHKLLWDAGLLSGPQPDEVEAEVDRQRRREERRRRRRREQREMGRCATGEALPSYSEKEGEGEVVLGKGEDRRHDDEDTPDEDAGDRR